MWQLVDSANGFPEPTWVPSVFFCPATSCGTPPKLSACHWAPLTWFLKPTRFPGRFELPQKVFQRRLRFSPSYFSLFSYFRPHGL